MSHLASPHPKSTKQSCGRQQAVFDECDAASISKSQHSQHTDSLRASLLRIASMAGAEALLYGATRSCSATLSFQAAFE